MATVSKTADSLARGVARAGGVSVEEAARWRRWVRSAVERAGTPVFVFSEAALVGGRARLMEAFAGLPVRHWWSFKTLPLTAAVRAWCAGGGAVEVVSEREFVAVRELGLSAADILINGPAKHAWLPRHPRRGLRVNFDSLGEIRALAPLARRLGWQVGLRVNTRTEENSEYPGVRAQFGLLGEEVRLAARLLRRAGLEVEVVHFHLRTNVPEARYYREAADEALALAAGAGLQPAVLDLGGGFPPQRVASRKGAPLDAGFSLASVREVVTGIRARHRFLREIWMENGRWLTAPVGALAVGVLDVKEGRREGLRTVICDGGRTLHALVATWERHAVLPLAAGRGRSVPTLVCGPTCMAFDNLGVHALPATLAPGDTLIWCDAGAYQLSWETRFSHGLAAVVWIDAEGRVEVVRPAEGRRTGGGRSRTGARSSRGPGGSLERGG